MRALDGTTYKGRSVRCNDAEDTEKPARSAQKVRNSMQKVRKNAKNTDEFEVFEKKSKKRSENENRSKPQRVEKRAWTAKEKTTGASSSVTMTYIFAAKSPTSRKRDGHADVLRRSKSYL